MTRIKNKIEDKKAGFALLMTLITLSVFITITLSVINLSIKQTRLAADTTSSEIAFHASNAGMECIRHWRRSESDRFESGESVTIDCLGSSVSPNILTSYDASSHSDVSGSGSIYGYQYEITWGEGEAERCSEMRFLVFVSNLSGNSLLSMNNMPDYIPGYPNDSRTCDIGGRCTVFSARGYSSACADKDELGTIQRDLLIEF